MKKEELIKMINDNFKDGDEVTFLYNNDGMDEYGEVRIIRNDTTTYSYFHYEYLKDGKWVHWNKENDEEKNWYHITQWDVIHGDIDHDNVENWWREITDKEYKETRKVIEIMRR